MSKLRNGLFVAFSFVGKHLNTKFQKISSNSLDFANFLPFWSILSVFWLKNGKKGRNPKKVFLKYFVLLRSIYMQNFRKFYQTVWILAIFFIFGKFWLVFGQKMAKKGWNRKIVFVVTFYFVGKHLHTKFQKKLSNCLDFANFLHFWSILAVFWLKNGQKRPKSKKKVFL